MQPETNPHMASINMNYHVVSSYTYLQSLAGLHVDGVWEMGVPYHWRALQCCSRELGGISKEALWAGP